MRSALSITLSTSDQTKCAPTKAFTPTYVNSTSDKIDEKFMTFFLKKGFRKGYSTRSGSPPEGAYVDIT